MSLGTAGDRRRGIKNHRHVEHDDYNNDGNDEDEDNSDSRFFFVAGTQPISHCVGQSVGRSVGPSVGLSHFAFYAFLGILRVGSCATAREDRRHDNNCGSKQP